ncbi:MAG: glucose-6-phosphate dehydrogenase [bacterium]|nr:glucose-6-phosphate dehydrogenase [bacterium]
MNKKHKLLIFGGTGDLSRKKLFPSLFQLFRLGLLPEDLEITGLGSRKLNDIEYTEHITDYVRKNKAFDIKKWNEFIKKISYEQCDITRCNAFDNKNRIISDDNINIFYLALAPHMHKYVFNNIRDRRKSGDRIIIEKPFGYDYGSAIKLNELAKKVFLEEQIYRIDHYLAKETIQNIFAFRFSNGIFEPIWNSKYIDSVYIEANELIGIENRSRYFDSVGIVRDMVQSHLLQLLSIITLDLPKSFTAEDIRDEKMKVFKKINKNLQFDNMDEFFIKGQYKGYLDEPGVDKSSITPTYAAMKIYIDSIRWQNVPFYLVTGKKMNEKCVRVIINFKHPPNKLFGSKQQGCIMHNQIEITIQPAEKICIRFGAKKPGTDIVLEPVNMVFEYKNYFKNEIVPAYSKLLLDIFKEDQSLFARNDSIEYSWQVIDTYEKYFHESQGKVHEYDPGSSGPDISSLFVTECHKQYRRKK